MKRHDTRIELGAPRQAIGAVTCDDGGERFERGMRRLCGFGSTMEFAAALKKSCPVF